MKKCISTSTEQSSRKSKYFHEPHIKHYRTCLYNDITFMKDFLKRQAHVNKKTVSSKQKRFAKLYLLFNY